MTGITTIVRRDGEPKSVDIDEMTHSEIIAWVASNKSSGIDGWHVAIRLMEWVRTSAIPADRHDSTSELLGIFRHYGFARHIRNAKEDGRVDITEYEWTRFQELVMELNLDIGA